MNREKKKRRKKKKKRKEKKEKTKERKNERTKEKETIENERIPLCLFGIRLGRANASTWSLRETKRGGQVATAKASFVLGGIFLFQLATTKKVNENPQKKTLQNKEQEARERERRRKKERSKKKEGERRRRW